MPRPALSFTALGQLPVAEQEKYLATVTPAEWQRLREERALWVLDHQKRNQLWWYEPANLESYRVHAATAREVGIGGGNRSSKTSVMLVEFAIRATQVVPRSLLGDAGRQAAGILNRKHDTWGVRYPVEPYPASKLQHHPIRARLLASSLKNAWDENIKPKLQWWVWNGVRNEDGLEGDPRFGHWGLIPQCWLLDGEWDKSWSESHQVLTLNLKGDYGKEKGSRLQVMGHNQDDQDYAQGSFDLIIEDELPKEKIHREHLMRTLDRRGQVITGGTPPDESLASVAMAWFYDSVYLPGIEGGDPTVFATTLWTEHNRALPADSVAEILRKLTPEERAARSQGKFLHLSGLVFPGFTERAKTWCSRCGGEVLPVGGRCPECRSADLVTYSHVFTDDDYAAYHPRNEHWPVLFYMDPHPARPTVCGWFAVDEADHYWQLAELEVPGNAAAVRAACERLEAARGWEVVWRKGDEKITEQGNQFAKEVDGQPFNIRVAFQEAGFDFEPANTNFVVARNRLLDAFKPDPGTRRPRFRVHESCVNTRRSFTHHVWKSSSRSDDVGLKEQPSRKLSDHPALARFLMMDEPGYLQCQRLRSGAVTVWKRPGVGRGRTGW